jgi:dTDP-4-dehydrorhamnose reductase
MTTRPWSCIVNASAFTAVDAAESQVAAAWRDNAIGPALLATAAARCNSPVVHVSTDYVFDGSKTEPYDPRDSVRPLNVYGESKAEGERGVRSATHRHVIVRTSWIISPYGKNFAKTMLQRAAQGAALRVVNDQTGCPTSATDLAAALRTISLRLSVDPDAPVGTYHFANAGHATWWELAHHIMDGARQRDMPSVPVAPISTAEYPTAAVRPAHCVLSTASLTRDYGIVPRPWQLALPEILDAMPRNA